MAAKLFAFGVWAVVAASAVFWGLRLTAAAPTVPAGATTAEATAAARGDLLRLFGAAPVQQAAVVSAPADSARFRLAGVVSPRTQPSAAASTSRSGVALIAVDGKPARAYRVGARVEGDWVLQSVSLRGATVAAASGGVGGFQLELPVLPLPATGSLPGLYAGNGGAGDGGPAIAGRPPAPPGTQPSFAAPPAVDPGAQNINDLPASQMQQVQQMQQMQQQQMQQQLQLQQQIPLQPLQPPVSGNALNPGRFGNAPSTR